MAGSMLVNGAVEGAKRLAENPAVRKTALEYIQKATGKNFSGVNEVVSYASKGNAPAAVVLKAMARAGVNPNELFDTHLLAGQANAAEMRLIEDMKRSFMAATSSLDATSKVAPAGDTAKLLINKSVINFARAKFGGSDQAVREAHAKLRMFVEMSTATLEQTLELHTNR